LSADEVLQAWRFLSAAEDELTGRDQLNDDERQQLAIVEGLDRTLDALPEIDIEFARGVYTTFRNSPIDHERAEIGLKMRHLTRADHDFGLRLWRELVRDPNFHVRGETIIPLEEEYLAALRAEDYERADAVLRDLGLTADEAFGLLKDYERAQHGENICNIGQLVLWRLTSQSRTA